MISPRKLIKIARKWQRIAALGRKRLSHPSRVVVNNKLNTDDYYFMGSADHHHKGKGSFVIYTIDKRRFVLPLSYLSNYIFQELFKLSEEEFGVSSSGPIILPCDSLCMTYILSFVQQGMKTTDMEKALLNYITSSSSCSSINSTFHQRHMQPNSYSILCGK